MATIYLRAGRYSLNWVEQGQRRRKSLGRVTPAEAEAALLGLERRIAGRQGAAGPVFEEWAAQYALWHRDEYPDSYARVEQILRTYLIPYFGFTAIGAITRQDVEGYKHARLGHVSAGTITKELRTLQACLNKAVDWEVIPVHRAKGVKPPKDLTSKPPRWYTRAEMSSIYDADAMHAHIWRLLANTGLRRSEAQQLRRQDVGEEAITVVSTPGARTKSAKWRLVPITPGARIALQGLLNESCGVEKLAEVVPGAADLGGVVGHSTPHDSPFIVPRVHGNSITRAFKRTLGRVGMSGSLHCLRHTYCSHLVMAGVPLRTVQVLAGHSSITVTEKYAHLAPSYLQEATRGLEL